MKKRGQAGIITIVLLILISLTAIIILWNVVVGILQTSSSRVDTEIITVKNTIQKSKVYIEQTSKNQLEFDLKRGTDRAEVSSLIIILEEENGERTKYIVSETT